MKDMVKELTPMVKAINDLAEQATVHYTYLVDDVIKAQSIDEQYIAQLLDGLLSFCFNQDALSIYKKLCRYYFRINLSSNCGNILIVIVKCGMRKKVSK